MRFPLFLGLYFEFLEPMCEFFFIIAVLLFPFLVFFSQRSQFTHQLIIKMLHLIIFLAIYNFL